MEQGTITDLIVRTSRSHGDESDRCHTDRPRKRPATGILIDGIFFSVSLAALVLRAGSPVFRTVAATFVAIVFEALPFMLIGSVAGGLVEVFISQERMSKIFPKGKKGVLLAAGLGLIFPVCECAVVPFVRRLLGKGVPPGAAAAYLLAGPVVNPVVLVSTGVAYSLDWSFAFLRLAFGYMIGVSVGLMVGRVFGADSNRILLHQDAAHSSTVSSCSCTHSHCHAELFAAGPSTGNARRIWDALGHGAGDFLDTGRFLVMGAGVAASINVLLPRHLFTGLAGSPVLNIGSAMALAVSLNLCSDADAFIASSMRLFWSFSSQMAFMLLGPMLDIKLFFMYRAVFRGRFIVFMAVMIPLCVMLAALGLHVFAGGGRG